jgi:hypothetical protein
MNWPVSKRRRRSSFGYDPVVCLKSLCVGLGSEGHFNGDTSPFARSRFNCEMTADLLDSFSHSLKAKTAAAYH